MTALGYFPEEIVSSVAPELTAPTERMTANGPRALTVGERRRRARKEVSRWFKSLPADERVTLPSRNEAARKAATSAAEAFKSAEAAERRRLARLAKLGEDAERDAQLLKLRIARLEAEAGYSAATRVNRVGALADGWWREHAEFEEMWGQVTRDLIDQIREQIAALERESPPVAAVRRFNAGDLSAAERQKYGL